MADLIPRSVRESFEQWEENTPLNYQTRLYELETTILARYSKLPVTADYMAPAHMTGKLFEIQFPAIAQKLKTELQYSLASRLALNMPKRLHHENLPDSILGYYPAAFERMERSMQSNISDPSYDPLSKFARFTLIATIPCGAKAIDLESCIPLTSVVLSVFRMRDFKPASEYLSVKGTGIWFRSHTDTCYLEEFNEEGFDRYYLRVAQLLKRRKDVRGIVGTSWYYDPHVSKISPRLSYLSKLQMNNGAFYMKHRMNDFDIQQATKRSPTRRQLYNEEKYFPTAYSLIWPRDKLLSWAQATVPL